MGSVIIGTGMHVPERKITNEDLSTVMDTDPGWIEQRTGVRTRFFATTGHRSVGSGSGGGRQGLGRGRHRR